MSYSILGSMLSAYPRTESYEADMQPSPQKYWDNCGSVHCVNFSGSSLKQTDNIEPEMQRRHLFLLI
jgi:hypothetical protein